MKGYLLITGLKCPSDLLARLAAPMAGVATCIVVPPDTVRVDFLKDSAANMDSFVDSIMREMQECNELEAQMGFFRN